jgi:uncharacterized protein (TIGR02996 family)
MTDEQAFLDILEANPADDTTRLVYADWLDDRGEAGKAEYLRLTVECVVNPPAWEASAAPVARLIALGEQLAEDWRSDACGRFDLVMNASALQHKIYAIKAIRELTGQGLAEAKAFVETLPQRIFGWLPLDSAVAFRSHIVSQVAVANVRIQPSEIHGTKQTISHQILAHYGIWNREQQEADVARFKAFLKIAMNRDEDEILELALNRPVVIAGNLSPIALVRRLAEIRALTIQKFSREHSWWISVRASTM